MILKYISLSELNFSSSWEIGWRKIQKLSKFDRLMTLFWFMGPFIYLIERSPADIWLTIICIIAKNINKKPSVLSGSFKLFTNHGKKAIIFPQTNKGIKIEIHADINALLYIFVSIKIKLYFF